MFVRAEGGFFAIRADEGTMYDPKNLADAFKKDAAHGPVELGQW